MEKYTNWIMVEAADGTSRGHGFMRPAQVAELLEVHRSTLDRWVRTGEFPPKVKYGARVVGWPWATVDAWMSARAGAAG